MLRDVGHPELVGAVAVEATIDEVVRRWDPSNGLLAGEVR